MEKEKKNNYRIVPAVSAARFYIAYFHPRQVRHFCNWFFRWLPHVPQRTEWAFLRMITIHRQHELRNKHPGHRLTVYKLISDTQRRARVSPQSSQWHLHPAHQQDMLTVWQVTSNPLHFSNLCYRDVAGEWAGTGRRPNWGEKSRHENETMQLCKSEQTDWANNLR